jgi:hypothetical protein
MKKYILFFALVAFSATSHAYLSLLTTGDMLQPQQFQIMTYLENAFNKYDGVNVNARGSLGFTEDLQGDFEIGLGEFDVMLGGYVKWVPIPDVEGQPAIGIRTGISYINWDHYSQTSIVGMPFLSKGVPTDYGKFTPYTGLPLGINSNSDDTNFFARLALGSEWTHPDQPQLHGIAELAFGLSKSFSSLNIGGSYDF